MSYKLVVFNIGWMKRYKGPNNDPISSSAEYITQHEHGYEMFNFLPVADTLYGYVQPTGKQEIPYSERRIVISRISRYSKRSVDGVLVAWVAPHPELGGTYLVGWYKNATVFEYCQNTPSVPGREYNGENFGYFVRAKASDGLLLPLHDRILKVPRGRGNRGGIGQSNVWYADSGKPNDLKFRSDLMQFISVY